MQVRQLLDEARKRLATVGADAPVVDVAALLSNQSTPLVVVCDDDGVAIGVVTRTAIVELFRCGGERLFTMPAARVMTRPFFSCAEEQPLEDLWKELGTRSLRCAPLLDSTGRPLGVAHARDVARPLLESVTYEELLLKDYVLGIGYR